MIAMDGVAVIDMRTAVLSTQAAADAFKALEEDPDYSANLEEAKSIQADRQAMAEKLQKDFETLSHEIKFQNLFVTFQPLPAYQLE